MVQLVMGLKGSGKTKRLIEMVNAALQEESGSVVVIEKDKKLTFDIPYQARLVFASDYSIGTVEFFKGLLSGLHAGNYDITHIFIDNFVKMMPGVSEQDIEEFLVWLDAFSKKENVNFTVSMTLNPDEVSEKIKSYAI
ncbi:MAG: ATP-binding protein [Oscillospiraceae bacterium]|nr:ATP-binding protein [Oscillospiraceae bacterium]